jgi:hydrogenase nickel incorporation protein HypA/HybF
VHEMSIAWELLQQLEEIADANDMECIESLSVTAGVLRGIVPEALQVAFQEAARGGRAEGAELELTIVPAEARCRVCDTCFAPGSDSFLCESCGQADVELVAGDEIILSSLTGQQSEKAGQQSEEACQRTDGGSER